jgi:hypothetical protein
MRPARRSSAARPQVLGHVLPVLGQLEGGADQVGQFLAPRRGHPEHVQHDPADRVGRQLAVTEQSGERLVPGDGLVLPVRLYEVEKGLLGDRALRHSGGERGDNGKPGAVRSY